MTLSPGFTVSGRQPPELACAVACISNDHSTGLPAASAAITCSHTCGFVHSNSLTTPETVMVFSGSNIANEWCATAVPADSANAALNANNCTFMDDLPKGVWLG